MDKPTVTITLPAGDYCNDGTMCLLAKYSKKWGGTYNCSLYHKILKGGTDPKKCLQCREHCKNQAEAQKQSS